MMKKLLWTLCVGLFLSGSVFAASAPPVSNGGLLPGPTTETLEIEGMESGQTYVSQKLIPKVVSGFLVIMLMVGVVMVIIGGITFIMSSGDTEQTKKAKDILFWALVSIVIAVMAFAIVKFIIGIDIGGLA